MWDTPASAQSEDRKPELDGLRGFVVLLIVFHHYVNYPLKPADGTVIYYAMIPLRLAWTGVDLFFVLSGFLVGGMLISNRDSTAFFRTFYLRRAYRILPLYLVLLTASYFLFPRVMGVGRPPLLPYLTFTQNFWMALSGTFGVITLAVTWSLAIEEQFYLVSPVVVRSIDPGRLWMVIGGCIAAAPLIRVVLRFTVPNGHFMSYVLLFTRMDGLMVGVLIAWLLKRGFAPAKHVLYRTWVTLGVVMLLIAWFERSLNPLVRILSYDVFALFYGATLLIVLRGGLKIVRMKALAYVGVVSYGIYLFHYPVHRLVRGVAARVGGMSFLLTTLTAFVITFVLAVVSWEFFEKRFVRLAHRQRY